MATPERKRLMDQNVLVFEAAILERLGEFQGFTLDVEKYLSTILDPKNNRFISRNTAEQSPSYKQVITYVVLRFKDSLFSYVRGRQAREKRLVGMRSIALGGHIEQADARVTASNRELYVTAAQRELNEEVSIDCPYFEHIVALINDDTSDVSRVHFGILHVWDLAKPKVAKREEEITKAGFVTISRLKDLYPKLEIWSQITLDVIEDPRIPRYSCKLK